MNLEYYLHKQETERRPRICHSEAIVQRCSVACNFIKNEALAQLFSCEFYEISNNSFF